MNLTGERAENVSIGSVETDAVALLGDLTVLLVERLTFMELHDGPSGPRGIGTELSLDEGDDVLIHGCRIYYFDKKPRHLWLYLGFPRCNALKRWVCYPIVATDVKHKDFR